MRGRTDSMQLDASTLPDGAQLDSDVAVVGAGPAGIVTALELAAAGRDVLLIESGRDSYDKAAQRLGHAVHRDPYHAPMSRATRRQVGGASVLWGGRCVPFDAIDFERRPIVDHARWPVAYEELRDYFHRACDWLVCGQAGFDARDIPSLAQSALVPGLPEGEIRTTSLERWSLPTNFARQYGRRLKRSPLVRLVTRLTCTQIVYGERGRHVDRLAARTLDGKSVTVRARTYVLACGGLETTRLLLASDRAQPGAVGAGTRHLGRWYMSHVAARIARARLTAPSGTPGHELDGDGVYVRRRFSFAPEFLVERRLSNSAMWLVNPEISDASHGSAILSLVYLGLASPLGRRLAADAVRELHLKPASRRHHARNVAADIRAAASFATTFGYGRYLKRGRRTPGFFVRSDANVYPLMYHAEHLPHSDSRVVLTDELDAVGMPRLETRLRFGDEDVDNVVRAHRSLDEFLRRHGRGRLEYIADGDLRGAIREQLRGGYHQAGTTRMSAAPEDGVVDRNLAVHGFDDLYVASSSAFVTSGQAHSTFMIVAFALRLADRLRGELSSRHARG
jgi:choline dehydrogenase-like flavoprotein